MRIENKIVIVTGASSGIGKAIVKLLTENGAKVALVARSKDKIEKLSKELDNSLSVIADMRKEEDIERMVNEVKNHFGRIDILVNNAGRGYDAEIEKIDRNDFLELFTLNVLGPLKAMQLVTAIMKKQGGGIIVNISSGTSLMYLPGMSAYSATKRALNAISLTAREELKEDGISVSVAYPYITKTDFDKNMIGVSKFIQEAEGNDNLRPADTAEYIAEKIIEGIKNKEAEIFAHDWMKRV